MASGFHKAECNVCNRLTWHYKEGDRPARCTDHSDYVPGRRRVVVGELHGGTLYREDSQPSEREIRIANRLDRSLWRVSEEKRIASVVLDDPWADAIFADVPQVQLDPGKLYCSFCGSPTDKINTTSERKPLIRKVVEPYTDSSGDVHLQEKVVSKIINVHACRNCCLGIRKPIVVRKV